MHFVFAELNSTKSAMDLRVQNDRTIDSYFDDGSIRTVENSKRI